MMVEVAGIQPLVCWLSEHKYTLNYMKVKTLKWVVVSRQTNGRKYQRRVKNRTEIVQRAAVQTALILTI